MTTLKAPLARAAGLPLLQERENLPSCKRRSGNQRWQCRDCTRAFAVTVGTIFHGTHIPLKMVSVNGADAQRKEDRELLPDCPRPRHSPPTVWSMMHRVRPAMGTDQEQALLHGIVEADEAYIGGKPGKGISGPMTSPANAGAAPKRPQ